MLLALQMTFTGVHPCCGDGDGVTAYREAEIAAMMKPGQEYAASLVEFYKCHSGGTPSYLYCQEAATIPLGQKRKSRAMGMVPDGKERSHPLNNQISASPLSATFPR